MQIEFYIDIWFLINMGINYSIVDITGLLWNWGAKPGRIFWGAVIGTLLNTAVLCIMLHFGRESENPVILKILVTLGSLFLVPVIMLLVVLGKRPVRRLILNLISLWGTAFLMGGVLLFFSEKTGIKRASIYFFTILCLEILFHVMAGQVRENKFQRQMLCWAEIYGLESSIKVRAFYDSGNCLKDPYTGKPVVIVSPSVIQQLDGQLGKGVLIPYYSLGNDSGMVPAYSCKGMDVWKTEGKQKKHFDSVMLAVDGHIFTHRQEYDLILHHSMV